MRSMLEKSLVSTLVASVLGTHLMVPVWPVMAQEATPERSVTNGLPATESMREKTSVRLNLKQLQKASEDNYEALSEVLAQKLEEEKMSIVDVFKASNTMDCLDLWLEGFCIWLVIRYYFYGVDIEVDLTPKISHYNPDFVVAAYPRIGGSPLEESDSLYETLQTSVSKAFVEILTGEDVPVTYEKVNVYGGSMSDSNQGQRDIAMFSEVEVIGHPGNIITMLASSMGDDSDESADVDSIMGAIEEAGADAADQAQEVVATLESDVVVTGTVGDSGQWSSLVPGAGDTSVWTEDTVLPADYGLAQLVGISFDSFAEIGSLVEGISNGEDTSGALDSALSSSSGELDTALSESGGAGSITGDFSGAIESIDLEAEVGSALNDSGSGISSSEVSSTTVSSEFSFCPKDTTMLTPHYLSGFNVLGWRYQLPELAYPASYAFPLPGSKYFVGNFKSGSVTATDTKGNVPEWLQGLSLPDFSTWGNIYPRSGWVAQPDEVKNMALAAFRAVHVVTRENQLHLYNFSEQVDREPDKVWHPKPIEPDIKKTGAWQQIYPKQTEECELLQDTEIEVAAGVARDPELTSETGAYIYNVWRQYECCQESDSVGVKVFLGEIEARVEIY